MGEKNPNHYAAKHLFQTTYEETAQIHLEFSLTQHFENHSPPHLTIMTQLLSTVISKSLFTC